MIWRAEGNGRVFLSMGVRRRVLLAGRTSGPVDLSQQGCARSSARSPADRRARPVDGPLAAGVTVIAVAGLILGFAVGTREPGIGTIALYTALCVPLALAAALTAGRRSAWRGGDWLHRAALAAVTLAGAVLCFHGLDFALPYVPHPDEPVVVDLAQRMLKSGDLNPHRFVYPSLYVYLQALVYALHLGWGYTQGLYGGVGELPESTARITTVPGFYHWGRALTALLATGSILLVYGSGRRLYGRRTGLLAALLLAFAAPVVA